MLKKWTNFKMLKKWTKCWKNGQISGGWKNDPLSKCWKMAKFRDAEKWPIVKMLKNDPLSKCWKWPNFKMMTILKNAEKFSKFCKCFCWAKLNHMYIELSRRPDLARETLERIWRWTLKGHK
jgi:hypothetical protein